MAITIYGAFRTDTTLNNTQVTYHSPGTTFQISSYAQLTMTDGADPTEIEGDSITNEVPNDPTQTFGGNAIAWDFTMQVNDGVNVYQIGVIDYDIDGDGAFDYPGAEQGYFLAFIGGVPPLNTTLTIGAITDNGSDIDVDTTVPCFTEGTRIDTPGGPRAIETLCRGDRVLTYDHGAQPVKWIGGFSLDRVQLARQPKLRPIRIRAGALGPGRPRRDLTVSPQHRLLVRSPIARRMFRASEVLIPAKKLLGLPGICRVEDIDRVTYYHMLFERHEIVFSEATPSESLLMGPQAVRAIGSKSFLEILGEFPEYGPTVAAPKSARRIVEKGRAVEHFLRRHLKNAKPLIGGTRLKAN